jgi:uracil-DNA glycosylase
MHFRGDRLYPPVLEVRMPRFEPPPADCPLCPRLVAFREQNRKKFPAFYNGAVPPFGGLDASLLIVGLAPGLKGANATGRPFTGDYAGDILYTALEAAGLAKGEYDPKKVKHGKGDGFLLINTRVTNAARCVPPENKPTPEEVRICNQFLKAEIAAMPKLKIILSLGAVSHAAVVRALGLKLSQHKFAHGAEHKISSGVTLLDSYHTSRYNINTGVLTAEMFTKIIARAKALL